MQKVNGVVKKNIGESQRRQECRRYFKRMCLWMDWSDFLKAKSRVFGDLSARDFAKQNGWEEVFGILRRQYGE